VVPVTRAVERAREAVLRRIAELERSFADIAASVDTANTDDEHDPEGATLAFERAQVTSLLLASRERLDQLDGASARIVAGTYGTCANCGATIGDERLAALPATDRCVECAGAR
jgi:RNA polymerase-binding transcription factor DksA